MRSVPEIVSAKLCARAGAHLLDAEQQHDAEGDGEHGQHGGQPAVAQGLQGEAQDDHAAGTPLGDVAISSSRTTRSKRGAELSSWLTMIERRAGRRRFGEQQIEKRLLAVAVERGRRLVGDDQLRRPISARAAATRCCWPTLRLAADSPSTQLGIEAEARRAGARLRPRPLPLRLARSRRFGAKLSGSSTLSRTEP